MKHPFSFTLAVVAGAALSALVLVSAPAQAEACVNVEVRNVHPGQGTLQVAAYADPASFDKTPVVAAQMKAGAATMAFPLCGLAGGSVALMVYQDLNGNSRLDSNVLGIPSEPWGASGKPLPMSRPTWQEAAVPLDGTTIVVLLSK